MRLDVTCHQRFGSGSPHIRARDMTNAADELPHFIAHSSTVQQQSSLSCKSVIRTAIPQLASRNASIDVSVA